MSELKAMGVNAFRTSHNPPSPEMIDVCQRLGIVMMVEAFDAWDVGKVIVAGSDRYRSVPAQGSVADQMVKLLDGLGLNTAKTIDGLHAQYPTKFFFESESSSETSTRGYYQDPSLLNTRQNFTPGRYELSSYDNNLNSWTLSNEHHLKKVRDRQFFAGQFLWAGWDRTVLSDDGKSLSYVTVHVVDARGVEVPDADNPIVTSVTGAGTFAGADNGKQDDAEG